MDSAEEIPWTNITEAHVSNLRGHVRFLRNIGTKLKVADKLEDYNKRAAQALADAEAAALIAGIEISPKDKANTRAKEPHTAESKRRRWRSPGPTTTSDEPDNDGAAVPKKVKFRSPVAVAAERVPEFSRRLPPTTAEIAQLSSLLGKHERPEDAHLEEMSEKGMKRNRNYYIEKRYWRRQQLEGEETDDEEDNDLVEFAPFPDYVRDRLPETHPAPKRRGSRPFTNELVVPVETDDNTSTEEKSKPLSANVTTEVEEDTHNAPKVTAATSSQKAAPTQTSQPEVGSNNPTSSNDSANVSEKPATTATAPHPEANKSRKRTTAESTTRAPKKPTSTPNPAQPLHATKVTKHSADDDTTGCPPSAAKRQRKYIQRLLEDSAKRNSNTENGNGPPTVKKRKVV